MFISLQNTDILVIKATGTVITRYGLRIPPSTEFSDVKDLLSEEANISGSSLEWILINKATEKIEVYYIKLREAKM